MTYSITPGQTAALITLLVWDVFWKSLALWRAAHRNQPYWFALLLIVNSVGIVPIAYLLLTNPRKESSAEPYSSDADAAAT